PSLGTSIPSIWSLYQPAFSMIGVSAMAYAGAITATAIAAPNKTLRKVIFAQSHSVKLPGGRDTKVIRVTNQLHLRSEKYPPTPTNSAGAAPSIDARSSGSAHALERGLNPRFPPAAKRPIPDRQGRNHEGGQMAGTFFSNLRNTLIVSFIIALIIV